MSMKNNSAKKGLIFFIIILLIISSVTIKVAGYDVEPTDTKLDKMLDNLRFVCISANGFDSVKYEYYKEQLLEQYSSHNNFEEEVEQVTTEQKLDCEPQQKSTLFVGPMDSPWPMKSHDVRHTGQSTYSTVDTCVEKWRFYSSGSVDCTPVIDNDGIIYFKGAYNHLDRYLYALYPNSTLNWRFKTGGLILGSSPALAKDGTIYVGSWDDFLYAINPNGTLKWKFYAYDTVYSSPVIADDGTIYIGTMGPDTIGRIIAVNPDGTEKWHYDTSYWITSDPAIGDDGTVYIGSQDDYLYSLYPNGTLRWRFKTGSMIMGPPSIAEDGTIYIGSWDDYLYALYPNGTEKWKHPIGVGAATNPSIASDGTIYVGHDALYAVNPDGTRKWTFNLGSDRLIFGSSPAISSDGTIYVGVEIGEHAGGEIIAISPDGSEKWRKKIAKWGVYSSPSIGEDGTVYIGSYYDMGKGYLHAFGPQETNDPPTAPSITGPTTGKAGTSYDYKFVASDPDKNPVSYYVEWGDSTNTGWTGDYDTGEEITLSHAWSSDGTFTIKAKARDTFGAEGPEASLTVTMPRNRAIQNTMFLWFLEQFPIFQTLLLK